MELLTIIFWLLCAHFVADYPLQSPEMGKYKNKRNRPTPPNGAKFVPVWPAYLTAHAFVHAALSALVVGPLLGFVIGISHFIQDYLKCKIQYSPNLDQLIHIVILIIVGVFAWL
jgi:quinol-cytochrome oxidoreductase complex cytochrome b subunit